MKEEIRKLRIKIHKIMLKRMGVSACCFFIVSMIIGGLRYRSVAGIVGCSFVGLMVGLFGYLCLYMFITPYDYHTYEG